MGLTTASSFFSGSNRQTAKDGSKQNQQYGKDGQGEQYTPTGRPSGDGTRENPIHAAAQPTQSNQMAATESLSMGELNMILKIMQQCVVEFPNIELGGMAERPDHLRKWRYAVSASLEAAGPHVIDWWQWSITTAEMHHRMYAQAPIMNREGIKIDFRIPTKWRQIEVWIRPKLLACLPQNLKKTLTQRGVQGQRDECQDILFLIFKACMPGAADEKTSVLQLLQNPTPCSKPESALNEIQRFWAAARRCQELRMAPPDGTILYTAFRSIFSNVFIGAGSNLQLRWMNLENNLSLPHIVSLESMQEVARFVEGELSYLVTQGTKTGNPGLPLTDNQKRQEATKKEQEVKSKKAAAAITSESPKASAATNDAPPRYSTSTSWWAQPCKEWAQGVCLRGISCNRRPLLHLQKRGTHNKRM